MVTGRDRKPTHALPTHNFNRSTIGDQRARVFRNIFIQIPVYEHGPCAPFKCIGTSALIGRDTRECNTYILRTYVSGFMLCVRFFSVISNGVWWYDDNGDDDEGNRRVSKTVGSSDNTHPGAFRP